MLRKKRSGHHPYPVMHEAGFVELSHACINEGISCFSIAPAAKFCFVVTPNDVVVFLFKGFSFAHARKMPKDHLVKFPPDQFTEIDLAQLFRFSYELANTYRSKAKMH